MVSRPQMIFYYPFERYTTSWLVWGHQVWMWSGSGNFVLGYDAILWPFYSCKILDSKCMYWSIVSIWCVGLSSNVCTCLKLGVYCTAYISDPKKKCALIAILVFILLSDINQDSCVVCIVILHCTLCSRIFISLNVMHLKEANIGLAHIVEAYIVITWSDFGSVYGDTLTKCVVATPGFMQMEMGFLFL